MTTITGQVTLVALGPLTNLALAFKTEPLVSGLLQGSHQMGIEDFVKRTADNAKIFSGLFIMGGNSEGIGNASVTAEFNFHADPEAAHVVIESARCTVTIVPWETCYKVRQSRSV